MRFVARVHQEDGTPLEEAEVTLVGPDGEAVGRGTVENGSLVLEGEPGPIWGLLIDGRPVVAVVASVARDRVDLGEITLLEAGLPAATFHAIEGRIYGLPGFKRPAARGSRRAAAEEEAAMAPAEGLVASTLLRTTLGVQSGLTFSGLVGSSANQIGSVARTVQGLNLTGASITLKGIPTVSEEAVGLEFPTPELAATGVGLSQLSFSFRPQIDDRPPAEETRPQMPDLIGYTRDLALRKLAAQGLVADITLEIVRDPADRGRVVRSLPQPGTPLPPETTIRLFIGKHEGS